jgi:hypothetical protein
VRRKNTNWNAAGKLLHVNRSRPEYADRYEFDPCQTAVTYACYDTALLTKSGHALGPFKQWSLLPALAVGKYTSTNTEDLQSCMFSQLKEILHV